MKEKGHSGIQVMAMVCECRYGGRTRELAFDFVDTECSKLAAVHSRFPIVCL